MEKLIAQTVTDFQIIPSSQTWAEKAGEIVKQIMQSKEVIKEYTNQAAKLAEQWDIWTAFVTWVFNWDLIFLYLKYLIKFLSQLWMVIWALMIIYAGYLYASGIFFGSNPQKWANAIKSAILGLLVVIFSYSILKLLTLMFL